MMARRDDAAPNASSRVAVALVVGGKPSYAHFAIATAQSLRAQGYDGDIVVFSQWVGPGAAPGLHVAALAASGRRRPELWRTARRLPVPQRHSLAGVV